MQLYNSGENARSYIEVTSRTFIPARPMTNEQFFVFSPFDFDVIAAIFMSFCVSMPHVTNIGSVTAEIWRLIDVQDDGRGCSILVLVSYLLMSLTSEGQYLSANENFVDDIRQFMAEIKQTSAILKFDFRYITGNGMLLCRLTNFIQMRPLTVEMTYLDSRPWHNYFRFDVCHNRNSTSGFDFDHITIMCMSLCRLPNFV